MKEVRSHRSDSSSLMLSDCDELRQLLIKKNEKIEFLKDHMDHLLEELHRKSRYILSHFTCMPINKQRIVYYLKIFL